MTMRVTAPGGIAVDFPDGTDPETINRVMRDAMERNAKAMDANAQRPTVGEDVLKSVGTGLVTGLHAIPGTGGDIEKAIQFGGNWIDNKVRSVIGAGPAPEPSGETFLPATEDVMAATGWDKAKYEPKTEAGKSAEFISSFIPGGAVFGARGLARTVLTAPARAPARVLAPAFKYGLAPGLASEGAGRASEATGIGDPSIARMAGALLGPAAAGGLRRVITPRRIPPENAAAARALRAEGVTGLTEGQVTQRPQIKVKERQAFGDRMHTIQQQQGEQFTQAALRRVGEDAPRATPEVVDRALTRIGGEFDRLTANNALIPDRQFAQDLRASVDWYAARVSPPNRTPIIGNYLDEIGNVTRSGAVIDGPRYQSLRSRLAADARSISDPDTARTLRDITEDLDDAMERSIAATNPADAGAFAEARRQYRNMLVIDKATTVAGSDAALGLISPSALRNATVTTHGRRNYARGQGDFAELSRSGEALLRPLPETGYAPARAPLSQMNSVAMALSLIPRGLRELRMSPLGRRYMTNTLLPPPPRAGVNSVAAALANVGRAGQRDLANPAQ